MRWSRIRGGRKRRCLKMKKVLGCSGFSFRCHRATNERERERERKREREREGQIEKVPNSLIPIR